MQLRSSLWRGVTALVVGAALLVSGTAAANAAAPVRAAAPAAVRAAAPAAAAIPQTRLWLEDFQNKGAANEYRVIYPAGPSRYVGAAAFGSMVYIANGFWYSAAQCNGFIVTAQSTIPTSCNTASQTWRAGSMRSLADVLGRVREGVIGSTTTTANNGALTSISVGTDPNNHATVLATNATVPLAFPQSPATSRFVGYGVDAADIACADDQTSDLYVELSFDDATTWTGDSTDRIQPCDDDRARPYGSLNPGTSASATAYAGHFEGRAAQLVATTDTAAAVRFRTHTFGGFHGNDFGLDNVGLYDQTPRLSAAFAPAQVPAAATSTLTLTVTNTDDLAGKAGWSFVDTLPAGLEVAGATGGTCAATTATTVGGHAVTVTHGNLPAGTVSCTITVPVRATTPPTSGTSTYSNAHADFGDLVGVDPPPAAADVLFYVPTLAVTKTVSPAHPHLGDTVTYTVSATNTSAFAATAAHPAVLVDDLSAVLGLGTLVSATAAVGGQPVADPTEAGSRLVWSGALAAGATVELTVTVTLPDALPPGTSPTLRNVAFAPGTLPPATTPVPTCPSGSGTDPATGHPCAVSTVAIPAVALTKSATVDAHNVVTYAFTVTNTGGTPLTSTTITDPHAGPVTFDGHAPGESVTLAAGDSIDATATHTATQAEVDAGTIENTATVTGSPPEGEVVTAQAHTTAHLLRAASLRLEKRSAIADNGIDAAAGDVVTYTFTLTNTGNTTLTDAQVDQDSVLDPGSITYAWPDPASPGVLPPGQHATGTATYALTQDDVDAGGVTNQARASAEAPTGSVDATAEHRQAVGQTAALDLLKTHTVDGETGAPAVLGSVVEYTFTVTNSGNVTVSDLALDDPQLGGAIALTPRTLAPGATATATASHTITQDDVDAGGITNVATVTGSATTGETTTQVEAHSESDTVATVGGTGLALTKTADVETPVAAGDTVEYTFTVENTGDLTLHGVRIDDQALTGDVTYDWPGTAGVLEVGARATATATHTLTQDDVDAGRVDNVATASALPPTGDRFSSEPATATALLPSAPAIGLTASASIAADAPVEAGDTVTFTFVVRNTGNVTLSDLDLTDLAPCAAQPSPAPPATLAPGRTATLHVECTLTQAEVDAGRVTGSALVLGAPPLGDVVTARASAGADIEPFASISLEKTGTLQASRSVAPLAGNSVQYLFTITNLGNVTLAGVDVADALPGITDPTFPSWPGVEGSLAPGEQTVAQASYVLEQSDLDTGVVTNTATATGTTPAGATARDTDSAQVDLPEDAAISLTVTGAAPAVTAVGELVTFTYTATNTGRVGLTDVTISDPMAGLSELRHAWLDQAGVLAPGDSVTATATYALTAADIARGTVADPATATGVSTRGTAVSDTADVTVTLAPVAQQPLPPIAQTGADVMSLAALAVAFLLAGPALLAVRRRWASARE